MIDAPFRAVLPRYVEPLLEWYESRGFTPNQLTVAGFAVACVAAFFVGVGWSWVALLLWWLSRLLDGTDGIYARRTRQVTDFGGYLDIVLDMASYGVMILGFACARPELTFGWAAILFLYVLCITSALAFGNLEEKRGVGSSARDDRSLRLGAGLAEGGETGIAYTLFLLFPEALHVLVPIWIAVLGFTVVARSLLAKKVL